MDNIQKFLLIGLGIIAFALLILPGVQSFQEKKPETAAVAEAPPPVAAPEPAVENAEVQDEDGVENFGDPSVGTNSDDDAEDSEEDGNDEDEGEDEDDIGGARVSSGQGLGGLSGPADDAASAADDAASAADEAANYAGRRTEAPVYGEIRR